MSPKVLFVYTSANKTLTGAQTGWYLPEAAHPYYELAPHAEVDFAAPAGPNPPIDEGSVENFKDEESVRFLEDPVVKEKFAHAKKLTEVKAADYDAIFYVGGHGPVLDLAFDSVNAKLVSEFWRSNKIVSAVCHGTAALVDATDANGRSIFAGGRTFTGFSNAEEELVAKVKEIPFLLETRIQELGGKYTSAEPWGVKVVVDGKLITGQNPASAKPLGETLLRALTA